MKPSTLKSFTAVLEPDQTRLRWTIARVPFDIAKAWPERCRLRVQGDINGFAFRTSLFPDPHGEGHILLVNKRMLAGANAAIGATVKVHLEPDMEERKAVMPAELAAALKQDRHLRKWFDGLTYSMRKALGDWVGEPKSTESRKKRAEQIVERLLLTLEGETETPPLLRAAFVRQPLARTGWEAMTPVQRRSHLLGIFYYRSADARERRAGKAVEEALRTAKRATGEEK